MKIFTLILALFTLSGCAVWNDMSEREQQTVVIAGSILAAGAIIAHSNDTTVKNCISTRSLETGCK